jgi:HEAT repeat protein
MRRGIVLLIVLSLAGCGKPVAPQAGGRSISHWLEAMHDPNAHVRAEAALKLGNVGNADARALPALIAALDDPQATVRRAAVQGLVKFGPAAKDAVPKLNQIRESDSDSRLREFVGEVLPHIQR